MSDESYNLACLMVKTRTLDSISFLKLLRFVFKVLPHRQREGFGRFLIALSSSSFRILYEQRSIHKIFFRLRINETREKNRIARKAALCFGSNDLQKLLEFDDSIEA